MAVQSSLKNAFTAFRKSFGRERKQTPLLNQIHDAFNALEEDALPLAEVVEHTTRLAQVLSENVPRLHNARARPTLAFCDSAITWLYEAKLKPSIKSDDKEATAIWEDTILNGLISPILDICEAVDEDTDMFGETIYPAICKVMRSSRGAAFGSRFARSLVLVLLETCAPSSAKSKNMLHDEDVFGVPALSKLIIDAKDYHYLDTLVELSFRMFSTQNGAVTRKSYATTLFDNDYAAAHLSQEVRAEISRIHAVTNDKNSEKHVLDIIRTMSSAQVQRPQIFATQDLSYCGTKYTQQAPSNVVIVDNGSLCVIICDKDNETDVLAMPFKSIERIKLRVQDAPRTLVEFTVSEAPLISSIRESMKTPTTHMTGSPLLLCVSIASSDVAGFEAALAARNLADMVTGNGVLLRRPAAVSTKLSQAVSGVELVKIGKSNLSQEKVDEMMNKYVNMPSTPDSTPERVVVAPGAPKKPADTSDRLKPLPKPATKPRAKKVTRAPESQPAVSTGRPRRACAAQTSKVIQKQVADDPTSEPEATPEQPRRATLVQDPVGVNETLPTPPDTRRTKLVGKTLVPGSPEIGKTQESPSSPISVAPSPTSKIVSKRKRADVEDDPIEPLPDTQELPSKVLPSSQHIAPRNTAATRAKAKYTTNAKKMRVMSPIPMIEEEPCLSAWAETDVRPAESSSNEEDTTRTQSASSKHTSTTRPTRSTLVAKKAEDGAKISAMRKPEPNVQSSQPDELAQTGSNSKPEVQKAKAKGPTKRTAGDEKKQKVVEISRTTVEVQAPLESPTLDPVSVNRGNIANPQLTSDEELIDVENMDVGDDLLLEDYEVLSSQEDELLIALAKAAKKATRTSLLEPKTLSPRVMTAEEVLGHADVDQADTIEGAEPETPLSPVRRTRAPAMKSLPEAQLKSTIQETASTPQPQAKQEDTLTRTPELPKATTSVVQTSKTHKTREVAHVGQASETALHIEDVGRVESQVIEKPVDMLPNHSSSGSAQRFDRPLSEETPSDNYSITCDIGIGVAQALVPPSGSTKFDSTMRIQSSPPIETPLSTKASSIRPRSTNPPVTIEICADSELDEVPEPQRPVTKPVFHPKANKSFSPAVPNSTRLELPPRSALENSARIKPTHNTFTRLLHSPQPGPKSAFASPQKRIFPGGGRPSVSFVDTPSIPRRKSSDFSASDGLKNEQNEDMARMLIGMSARTGGTMMQIVEVLNAIQMTIAQNLSEKVKVVTTDARNARAELTRAVVAKLETAQVQAEHQYDTVHEFEAVFATQTQEFLSGCNRVLKCSARIDSEAQEVSAKNARAGQRIAKAAVNFELPDVIAAHLASD